jgi:hypothetical protein
MNHAQEITRDLWYWLYGGGAWQTKFHCVSGDRLLMHASILCTLWMVIEYVRFARANRYAMTLIDSETYKEYHRWLERVFVECGAIHVINGIIAYVFTPYWLVVGMTLHNAWQTRRLNASKLTLRASMAMQRNELEAFRLEKAREVLGDNTHKTLRQLADELKQIVG